LMVALTALDSNRIDGIISYKQGLGKFAPRSDRPASDLIDSSPEGEVVARQIRQVQRRSFREEETEAIIFAYECGRSTNALAGDYGCHRRTISNHLKKHGVEVCRSKIKSEETSQEIVALYGRGHNAKEVGEFVGLSETTIQRHLLACGVAIRGRWGY